MRVQGLGGFTWTSVPPASIPEIPADVDLSSPPATRHTPFSRMRAEGIMPPLLVGDNSQPELSRSPQPGRLAVTLSVIHHYNILHREFLHALQKDAIKLALLLPWHSQ